MALPSYDKASLWKSTLAQQPGIDPHKEPRRRLREAFRQFRERVAVLTGEIAQSLPDFTVHDVSHLDALWHKASLASGGDFPLTPAEAFVLGGAILIHDAGMGLAAYPGKLDELRKTKEWTDTVAALIRSHKKRAATSAELLSPPDEIQAEAVSELLRRLHAIQAEKLADTEWKDGSGTPYYLIDTPELRKTFGEVIGKIARSHWLSVNELSSLFKRNLNPPDWCPAEWTVDPLKLACLLRVADACHIDSLRAPGFLWALRKPQGSSDDHWKFQNRLTGPRIENGRMVYTSSAFPIAEADAWWLCVDTIQMIDRELRQVDALLADTQRPRLEARSVAGADHPSRLNEFIPTKDWAPVDARVRVTDVPSLVERLGGEQLYGKDPIVPLRELIQNASDAIKARRLLESRSSDWGEITVRLGQDEMGHWLELEDNGVGMSQAVLTGALLDFGKSFWNSREMLEQFPGLAAKGFEPTGRYGIGFFSVFMWGHRIRVVTRRYDAAQKDSRVLEFTHGPSGWPILRLANETEWLRDGGTRIRVWLKTAPDQPGGLLYSEGFNRSLDFPSDLDLPGEILPSMRLLFMMNAMSGKINRTRTVSFSSLCEWLCPSLDVDLHVEEPGKARQLVIKASDWISLDGEKLMKRLGGAADLGKRLRLLRDTSGKVIGRVCVGFGLHDSCITVGGMRACDMNGFSGILAGVPLVAARNKVAPVEIDDQELVRWSAEQASLLRDERFGPGGATNHAEVIRLCGGDVGMLRFIQSVQGWVNTLYVKENLKNSAEVFLINEAVHELALESNIAPDERLDADSMLRKGKLKPEVLFVRQAEHKWSDDRSSIDMRGYLSDFYGRRGDDVSLSRGLVGVVLEALAEAWSTNIQAILGRMEVVEREIGIYEGKPVRATALLIRKPAMEVTPIDWTI
jgi:hypothetical protein